MVSTYVYVYCVSWVIGKDISSFRELLFRLLAVKEGVAVNTVMNFKFI